MSRIALEKKICKKCGRELVRITDEEYYIVSVIGDRQCQHEWQEQSLPAKEGEVGK